MNQRNQRLRQFLRAIRLLEPRGYGGRALSDCRTKRRFGLEPPDRSNHGCGIPVRNDEGNLRRRARRPRPHRPRW